LASENCIVVIISITAHKQEYLHIGRDD